MAVTGAQGRYRLCTSLYSVLCWAPFVGHKPQYQFLDFYRWNKLLILKDSCQKWCFFLSAVIDIDISTYYNVPINVLYLTPFHPLYAYWGINLDISGFYLILFLDFYLTATKWCILLSAPININAHYIVPICLHPIHYMSMIEWNDIFYQDVTELARDYKLDSECIIYSPHKASHSN